MKKIISSFLVVALLAALLSGMSMTAFAASNLTASEDVIELIKSFEGFSGTAYWDNSQWSIGYGTVSSQGATISQADADAALRQEVAEIDEDLNAFTAQNGVTLTQYQHDALVSLSFNCGTKWMNSSGRLRDAVISGKTGNDFLFAISLWANINSVPNAGLLNRRMSEANLYLNGVYSKTPPSNYTYVILNPNGGTPGHNSEDKMQGYISGSAVPILADNPTKSGYSFGGWFTSTSGGDCVTELNSATAGKTLYAQWGVKVTVTGSYANVRSGAGASNPQVGTVNSGDTLVIVETTKVDGALWGRFSKGWVALEYTDYSGTEIKNEETIATGTVKCTTSVNLRSGAGTNYSVCGSVTNGTKVKIYEEKTVSGYKWGRIDGGWIRLDYVTLDSSPSSSSSGSSLWEGESGSSSTGKTGTVTSNGVNIRKAAGTGNAVVGSANKGDKVTVYEQTTVGNTPWGRIGDNKWICMNYVKLDSDESSDSGSSSESGKTGTVTAATLNVRSGAGTGYTRVGTLSKGDKVTVYETKTVSGVKWGRIGTNRWVCLSYVSQDSSSDSLWEGESGGSSSGSTSSSDNKTGTVTATTLNVRTAPGTGYAKAGTLSKGDKVTILETKTVGSVKWGRIGTNRWICLSYVDFGSTSGSGSSLWEGEEDSSSGSSGSTQTGTAGTVTATSLNVRSGAGTNYTRVGTLAKGTKVTVYETKTVNGVKWGRIGENRWVSLTYVSKSSDSTDKVIATGVVKTSSGALNVRSGAGTNYTRVGSLASGTKINIYEEKTVGSTKWGRTDKGWVSMDYVKVDGSDSGLWE